MGDCIENFKQGGLGSWIRGADDEALGQYGQIINIEHYKTWLGTLDQRLDPNKARFVYGYDVPNSTVASKLRKFLSDDTDVTSPQRKLHLLCPDDPQIIAAYIRATNQQKPIEYIEKQKDHNFMARAVCIGSMVLFSGVGLNYAYIVFKNFRKEWFKALNAAVSSAFVTFVAIIMPKKMTDAEAVQELAGVDLKPDPLPAQGQDSTPAQKPSGPKTIPMSPGELPLPEPKQISPGNK